jgi:hypothetical protein
VGSNIAINSAMIAITTKSSIKVKPFGLRMTILLLFQRRFPRKPTFLFRHDGSREYARLK